MILILDNYDSFTYNLYQTAGEFNQNIKVAYNDKISIEKIENLNPSHIIISPGPGRPKNAGICKEVIAHFAPKTPILGVCLGHQAICEVYGSEIIYAKTLLHGKTSQIHIANGNPIFNGMAPLITAGRYHSLAVSRESLPDELLVIAETDDGEIMGVSHRDYELFGIQFHPESILTPNGCKIIENFLTLGGHEQ